MSDRRQQHKESRALLVKMIESIARAAGELPAATLAIADELPDIYDTPFITEMPFIVALNLARRHGMLSPLKVYLASDRPLSPLDRRNLADAIGTLRDAPPPKRSRGRPQRSPDQASAIDKAERCATQGLAFYQEDWCKRSGRQRLTPRELQEMIREIVAAAAVVFGVPANRISEANIRRLRKTGRYATMRDVWHVEITDPMGLDPVALWPFLKEEAKLAALRDWAQAKATQGTENG
jgi:hypothetical protein